MNKRVLNVQNNITTGNRGTPEKYSHRHMKNVTSDYSTSEK